MLLMNNLKSDNKIHLFCLVICFFLFSLCAGFANPRTSLFLSFLGDTMAHVENYRIADYSVVYEHVRDILLSDDLTFSNLEAPVDEKLPYKDYPRFNIHREYVQAVIDAGIEVFPLANNHSLDQNVGGIYRTLGSLMILRDDNEMNIYFSGTRGNVKQEFKPVEIRKKGFRIGFISVTAFINFPGKNPYIHMVDYRNKDDAETFLTFIKKHADEYDLFIVSYHAGREYARYPERKKIEYFRQLIRAGVDIVYGHHPHVLQPYEVVDIAGCRKLILYSMGNFISAQRWNLIPYPLEHYRSYTGDSLILTAEIIKTDKGPSVENITQIFITNHINDRQEIVVDTYDNMLKMPLSEEWEAYYRGRYAIISEFVSTFGALE